MASLSTSGVAQIITAMAALAWPAFVAFVIWKILPLVQSIIGSRAFSIKVAGMEISVQDATEQLSRRIGDLEQQVVGLRATAGGPAQRSEQPELEKRSQELSTSVLWVDDKPSGNAFEIAELQKMGVQVITALSTMQGIEVLGERGDVKAVISDMGRNEDGIYHGKAGVELVTAMRQLGFSMPAIVYTTAKYAGRRNQDVAAAGGDGAISSHVELIEWIRRKTGDNPSSQ